MERPRPIHGSKLFFTAFTYETNPNVTYIRDKQGIWESKPLRWNGLAAAVPAVLWTGGISFAIVAALLAAGAAGMGLDLVTPLKHHFGQLIVNWKYMLALLGGALVSTGAAYVLFRLYRQLEAGARLLPFHYHNIQHPWRSNSLPAPAPESA
jgi:hypothetical protein